MNKPFENHQPERLQYYSMLHMQNTSSNQVHMLTYPENSRESLVLKIFVQL